MGMREEMSIRLFMLMELENCRNKLGWLIRHHNCIVDNCPEEDYPPMPRPIPPGYTENLGRRMRKAVKGILPPTIKMILKRHYPIPQHVKHPFIHRSRNFHRVRHHQCRTLFATGTFNMPTSYQ